MCGICGFLSKQKITIETLRLMNDTMYHRGPNDRGEEIFELQKGYNLGLAQRRLSILDLSSFGHQPMHSQSGRVSIVFNGEIYNYQEIKNEIADYSFASNCDTEVIIAAYLKWGISCINRFNGMFAIALYDREIKTLFLTRDRMGKKPLYYWLNNNGIVFASECKPIMHTPGFDYKINEGILAQYLCNGYINAPESIFTDVYKLNPGHVLEFKDGEIKDHTFWDALEEYKIISESQINDYSKAKELLKRTLLDSVGKRLVADVPVGCFLSGGYDSTLVTAMAQSLSKKPIRTFSIGFDDPGYNEAQHAKEIANYFGTNHTEHYITEKDMLAMVESIPKYYDEPFADPSEIPTMLVSELARKYVTVALSGDGGDELFCGYDKYRRIKQAQRYDVFGNALFSIYSIPIINKTNILSKLPYGFRVVVNNRNKTTRTQIRYQEMAICAENMLITKSGNALFDESKYMMSDWQIENMLLDQQTYLPSILCKMDRASMKYSLECRSPLLDYRVVELSYKIPQQYKYNHINGGKAILKDIVHDYVPSELVDRPKQGFSAPIAKWLRGTLKEMLLSYVDMEFLADQGIFDPIYTKKLIIDYLNSDKSANTALVWNYFVFQQWYQYNIISA